MTELAELLWQDQRALKFFTQLAPSYQRRYQSWFDGANSAADSQVRLRHIRHELAKAHQTLKIGSYMGDVALAHGYADDAGLRAQLIERSESATQRQMAVFAECLVRHIAATTGMQNDAIALGTLAINAQWLAGQASFQDARAYAGKPMLAARAAQDDLHKTFYLMCHQASLTPHVIRHALIAADFSIGVINLLGQSASDERQWQLKQLEAILRHEE